MAGARATLSCVIAVLQHDRYQREGNDLRMTLPVELYTLVLGGEVTVPTLKGRVSLEIPPETRAGRVLPAAGPGHAVCAAKASMAI